MFSVKQAVILAGGLGTRLRPITDTIPKPMVPVNGRPFLEYLVEMLKENGIKEIVLCLGYLPEKITEHFWDGSKFGIKISYSISEVENETGKRLKLAEPLLDQKFLLMYCDNYWSLQLEKMIEAFEKHDAPFMMTVYTNKYGITKNNVLVGENNYVVKYDQSRQDSNLNCVDIGFMIVDKSVLNLIGDENCNFEAKVYPILVENHKIVAFKTDHRYYSISTPEKLQLTEDFMKPKKFIILDRDGVINKKPPRADYVKKWSEFEFLPESIEGMKLLKDNGFKIIIATNQPGIARGVMTKEDLEDVHENLKSVLSERGVTIDRIYVCDHGWNDGCDCRKPNAGLLFQAANDFKFDLTKTFYIGDDERDMEAGKRALCKTFLVSENESLLKVIKSSVLIGNGG